MQSLPGQLHHAIGAVLQQHAHDSTPVVRSRSVGGGCINHVVCLETEQGAYLLKWHPNPPPGMFLHEARGLQLMDATQMVRVPLVLAAAEVSDDHPAYIVTEWIAPARGAPRHGDQAVLGAQLAAMHRNGVSPQTPPAYGLDHDNYLGTMPQYNGWHTDWVSFYRERRLRPQMEMAQRNGYMPAARQRGLERVMARLERWLGGVERRPALLHGDLWGGNVIAGPQGEPVLIDPAVSYGDREAEIAYTQLFGGFDSRFYQAYQEAWALPPGSEERCDLYNLYHLINHLNHFGEAYGAQVDAVIQRYGG
jgi:fructosamine-3-kinase